jgi:outer membrane protein OmpA-like peptidoglycan-associated protein
MPNIDTSPFADTDGDLLIDIQELDRDSDGDLIPDYLDFDNGNLTSIFGDADTDGINDQNECGPELPCRDTDNNMIYDFLDLDSDNDGLTDDEEADGIANNGAEGTVMPKDTDADGLPDYRDLDSDNDGINDVDEIESPHDSANPKDLDNDGIPDVVDFDDNGGITGGGDSDNDGLTDAEECPNYPTNCPDSDNDGQPDYFDNNSNDADKDGISDSAEDPDLDNDNNPATDPRDTDGDGTPDYQDIDSDNDGKKDEDERDEPFNASSPRDTDGDGIPDVTDFDDGTSGSGNEGSGPGDSDRDGISDADECASTPCRDTDRDGIPDYADSDSDGDGISDANECNSSPNCSDSDKDGLADYLDADSSPANSTANSSSDSDEGGTTGDLGTVKTGVQGAGSIHWGFALILASLVMLRRKSAVLIALPIALASWAASADWSDEMDLYVGAGIGQSYLDPSLGNSSYSIDDDTQNAWKLTAGLDLNDHISVEGYYSDLGSVKLNPDGKISYRMMGADAILHFWAYGDEREKGSIALYAKAGVNHMTNNSSGVSYDKVNTIQLLGGIGAEVYLPRKFSVRFEIESYDTDASLLSLNLVKRFGFKSRKPTPKVAVPIVVPVKEIVYVPVVLDSDLDGLLDAEDQCPNSPKGTPVDEVGCSKVDKKMDDLITKLQFESNSSLLTKSSQADLNEIAGLLVNYPDVKIEVQAHSDDTGSSDYNKMLSQMRADSVVRYLEGKNITRSRLDSVGFGEEQPIADNNTSAGRAKNRRVEFVLKQP